MTVESVSRAGNVLTIAGVVLTQEIDRDLALSLDMGAIVMTEGADGSVAIAFAPDFRLTLSSPEDSREPGRLVLLLRNDGLRMVASATDAAISYDYSADALVMGVEEFTIDSEPMDLTFDMVLRGLAGRYTISSDDTLSIDSSTRAASVTLDISAKEPEGGGDGSFDLSLSIEDFDSTSTGTRLELADPADPMWIMSAIPQGFSLSGTFSNGPAEFSFELVERGERTYVAGSTQGGSASVELTGERVGYSLSSTGTTYAMAGPDMPIPEVGLSFDEMAIAFSLPAAATDSPQPMSALVRMVGLAVDEALWSMIDAAGRVPHTPATLIVDIVGQARLTYGLFDPRSMMGDQLPGELHALHLRELRASVAGAELTGSGAFIFDNSDTVTFDGLPRPMGEVDLRLVGGNALIENLVALGLLPDDQAQAAQMALMFFARPGDGPDTLESRIEITPDGGILANGQPVQ
jgi:hypothetical protein